MQQRIAVLVSCPKPSKMFSTKYIMPIQVGCAFKEERFENCLYDDRFENMSQKNKRYFTHRSVLGVEKYWCIKKKFDSADYASYDYSVSGFLAERLAEIYFNYLKS